MAAICDSIVRHADISYVNAITKQQSEVSDTGRGGRFFCEDSCRYLLMPAAMTRLVDGASPFVNQTSIALSSDLMSIWAALSWPVNRSVERNKGKLFPDVGHEVVATKQMLTMQCELVVNQDSIYATFKVIATPCSQSRD